MIKSKWNLWNLCRYGTYPRWLTNADKGTIEWIQQVVVRENAQMYGNEFAPICHQNDANAWIYG